MKRIAVICIMIITMLICFASCQSEIDSACDRLNDLADKQYSSLTLNVQTKGEQTLTAQYVLTQSGDTLTVSYSFDKLNPITVQNNVVTIPSQYKSTLTGSMVITNGVVTEREGQSMNLSIERLKLSSLDFKKKYFSDTSDVDGVFTAKVTNPTSFLGTTLTCSNMTVEVVYTTSAITSITISYTDSDALPVQLVYTVS